MKKRRGIRGRREKSKKIVKGEGKTMDKKMRWRGTKERRGIRRRGV